MNITYTQDVQPENKPFKPESRARKFWRVVLGSMLGFLLSSVIVSVLYFILFISMFVALSATSQDTATISDNSILKVDLGMPIRERTNETPFDKFNSYYTSGIGLDDILASIKNAATDPKIKGIYINNAAAYGPPATLKEIRDALLSFKQSGKFIYAYSDYYAQNGYYIASVADKVILNPAGMLEFKGYAFQVMFYKGFLDKMDIDVQIVRHGQFKSAVEPYILDKMSEANREQMTVLANSLWETFIADISKSRHVSTDSLNLIADKLLGSIPEEALRLRLVDKLGYAGDAEQMMKERTGTEELKLVSLNTYKGSFNRSGKASDKIAVVYATGNIRDGKGDNNNGIYSESFIKELRKAAEDKGVKAIVLRINSPGGSAIASENIWQEIEKVKQSGKTVVTSMGDYAASGGYYIACNSDYIIAQPNTLTGSIGVFGIIPSLQDFLKNKLGITIDRVKSNAHSDYGTGFRALDQEEMSIMQRSIEQTYATFTGRVADGRRLSRTYVDSIGQGRVWAGKDALDLGLVDNLGSLDDAIAKAALLAGLTDYATVAYPRQKSWYSQLLGNNNDEVTAALKEKLGKLYFTYEGIDQILSQEGVQARMPMNISIQ